MGEIQVNDWDGFRAILAQCNALHGQIAARRDAGAKVAAAAAAAADSEGGAAPVYEPSLTALGGCIDGCGTHVDAAAAAVSGVLAELEMVVNGMQGIDTGGAQEVQNV
ncbi:hypothetical protein C5U48_02585 [Mycolicibacter virginiensis]|uniref:Uncharacterized protein n=1 Tax=Mycolicibacter virginiensis TaxID=1795032 RepID=A0A9X7IR82_9MYCO|nr:hypothetical protein [Mycolicibacter virginiensis]PQM53716.1 hypothetical protein C5U48_02585 [Mycolicibacter virginiensis]